VTTRVLAPAAACLALLGAGVGCGGSKLSGDSIEKLVVEDAANRGLGAAKVACDDVDNEVGERFTCDVSGIRKYSTFEGKVARNDGIEPVGPDGGYR
jgi:hypothetical protein